MARLIHQNHDKLFKQALSDIRVAKDFFKAHLPPKVLQQADLETLKIERQTFIDEAYKATEADILYSVQLEKNLGYFYLLCEHQSTVDQEIAFRLLAYIVRIMENHRKQHPKKSLPIVYPLIVYSGEKRWNSSLDIFELFGDEQVLAKEVMFKPCRLIDIHRMADDDLHKHRWSGLVEYVLKYQNVRRNPRGIDILLKWLEEIAQLGGLNYSKIVLYYWMDNATSDDQDIFIERSQAYFRTIKRRIYDNSRKIKTRRSPARHSARTRARTRTRSSTSSQEDAGKRRAYSYSFRNDRHVSRNG